MKAMLLKALMVAASWLAENHDEVIAVGKLVFGAKERKADAKAATK